MQTETMTKAQNAGLALLRFTLGSVFLAHGAQKLFVYGFSGVGAAFAHMGIPLPQISAVVVSLVEFFGGAAVLVGLITRPAAALIAVTMLVASGTLLPHGFFAPQGAEFPLSLLGLSLALVLTGPGEYSLDALLSRRRNEGQPHRKVSYA